MEKATAYTKFRVKADLAVFEALQRDGRLSEEGISKQTQIPATTVHCSLARMRKREFFSIKAVPRLEKFAEIPTALIGFSDVHPLKIEKLKPSCVKRTEVVQFFHSDKNLLLMVMEATHVALTHRLSEIMTHLDQKPAIYIKAPVVGKFQVAIPDKVLEGIYGNLPDRRIRVA